MNRPHQDEMTEARVVAIWIGDQRDELKLDEYLTDRFEADFGFTLNERMMPEIDTQPEPVPLPDLLKGFSMWESWHEAAVSRCAAMGIKEAASAVVFHFLRFDPDRCTVPETGALRFIGNFDWPETKLDQQAGPDLPATAPEPKPEVKERSESKSEVRPQ